LLLIQALRIALGLIKLAVLLVAWCGCLLAVIITGSWYRMVRYLRRSQEPEPASTDNDDAHTIELPRERFRRLRG
jgi:hypothetical protein